MKEAADLTDIIAAHADAAQREVHTAEAALVEHIEDLERQLRKARAKLVNLKRGRGVRDSDGHDVGTGHRRDKELR